MILRVALLALALFAGSAHAEQTTGGVTFADTLGYTKPAFYPITVPTEASVSNKYYVDFTSGSGTTCSSGSPCGSLSSLSGKAGMNGGPAYVYVRGTTTQLAFPATFQGSAGNEIVIKHWGTDVTTINAAGGGQFTDAVTIGGANVNYLIFDGGPSMLIRFVGSGYTTCQNAYTVVVQSDYITLYRVRINVNDSCGPGLGPGNGSGTSTTAFRFINSELYNANRYYGVYTGGGTGCAAGDTSHTDLEFRNSIFRDIDGRGIQIEPRANSSGVIIDGNAFYEIGANASGNMNVSPAIAPSGACGGDTTNIRISNNIAWQLYGGFVEWELSSATNSVYNNTVWDYANSDSTPTLNFHGITSYTDGSAAVVRNNIIIQNNSRSGVYPHNRYSGWTASYNLCGEPTTTCAGTSGQTGTAAATFQSTSTSSADFLKPLDNGPAENNGVNLYATFTTDYLGNTRPSSGAWEIGAMEYGTAALLPGPGNPRWRPADGWQLWFAMWGEAWR